MKLSHILFGAVKEQTPEKIYQEAGFADDTAG